MTAGTLLSDFDTGTILENINIQITVLQFDELKADSCLMRRVSSICNLSFTLSCAKMEGEAKLIS